MKQTRLGFGSQGKTIKSQADSFDQRNLECARLVLDQVEAYGGEEAGLVVWARVVLQRLEGRS